MAFKLDDSRMLDGWVYDMILSDVPRGLNRAKINSLANGAPPFTEVEARENNCEINSNNLKLTRRLHDARSSMANGLLKPANQFTCRTDWGAKHKRQEYGTIVTKEISQIMKRSPMYFESIRSKIGQLVLHGIAPSGWEKEDAWCQRSIGIEDMLIPSGTLLGFENLPFFAIRRSFTGMELQKLTFKEGRDPGWQMPMVDRCLRWVDKEMVQLRNGNWPDMWSPEKVEERIKEGGYYYGDSVPTVDCFDIYAYDESDKESGWIRRVILDSWGAPQQSGIGYSITRKSDDLYTHDSKNGDFLYTSGTRKVARSWQEIVSFQYADLSAVFPAMYHNTRSLGFLLFTMCHMDNRMQCQFQEAVLEALMPLYKVQSKDDMQNALKLNLIRHGFIDDTIKPVPAQDRWQPNANLIELGMQQNDRLINESSGGFSQQRNYSQDNVEKTKFQVMAELNADTAMIGAAMAQAYFYQVFEYRENFRRFQKEGSSDVDVQRFQAACLKQGVPEKILYATEAWDIEPERVMGGGNKTMELTIAQQLWEWSPALPPAAQSKIHRMGVLALTGDVAQTDDILPDEPKFSPTVHNTELTFAAIMSGTPITPDPTLNALEVAGTMLRLMAGKVGEIMQSGGVGTPQDVKGLGLCAQYIGYYLQNLSQDDNSAPIAKQMAAALGKLVNEVKGMAQRQQEMAQKAQEAAQSQNGNGQPDPDKIAKLKLTEAQGEIKLSQMTKSHAARTAQREVEFLQKLKQEREQHLADLEKTDLEAEANIARATTEPATKEE